MAYNSWQLVPGVRIHSPGREPERGPFDLSESAGSLAFNRFLARRQLVFYNMGASSVTDHVHRAHLTASGAGTAAGNRTSLYDAYDSFDLACVCRYGHQTDPAVFSETVPIFNETEPFLFQRGLFEVWKTLRGLHCGWACVYDGYPLSNL